MSKNIKRQGKDQKDGVTISMKEAEETMEKFRLKSRENLNFELKYFIMAISILLSTNIYIHKKNLNNYNFKIIILISLYFSRRIFSQLWYHYRIREHLIFTMNKIIFYVVIGLMIINIIYIFWDLLLSYSIYTLLPLFYLSLLQIPIFRIDSERYENAAKEMMRCIKKISYLSLEVCYYGIFIPIFFSMKYSPYLNIFAIFIYTMFTWINCAIFLSAHNYYKKSAELHFHTKTYGNWKRIKKSDIPAEKFQ